MTQEQQLEIYLKHAGEIDLFKLATRMGLEFKTPAQQQLLNLFQPENYWRYDTITALVHRRAGKSFAMAFVLFSNLLKPYFPSAIIAPTFKHSKRVFNDIIKFTTLVPEINFKILKSDYVIEAPDFNSSVNISSSSAFENNLVGSSFSMILIDESYLVPEDDYVSMLELLKPTQLLYGTNSTYGYPVKNSHWVNISTPRGRLGATTISNIFLNGMLYKKDNPNVISLELDVTYSPHIDNEFLELEKKTMAKSKFLQEYYVKHIEDENTVFRYDEKINTFNKVDENYKGFYSLVLGVDIGYRDGSACSFVLYNEKTDKYYVIDELFVTSTLQERFLDMLIDKVNDIKKQYSIQEVVSFCDPSAIQFRMYAQSEKEFILHKAKNDRLPSIEYINTLLEERADGSEPELFIHPNCTELTREMRIVAWKNAGTQESFINDPTGISHWDMIDTLRYALYSHKFYKSSSILSC